MPFLRNAQTANYGKKRRAYAVADIASGHPARPQNPPYSLYFITFRRQCATIAGIHGKMRTLMYISGEEKQGGLRLFEIAYDETMKVLNV